jgi:hypothetical protein
MSAAEKIAIVHLGFYAYEDYKKEFGKAAKTYGQPPPDDEASRGRSDRTRRRTC